MPQLQLNTNPLKSNPNDPMQKAMEALMRYQGASLRPIRSRIRERNTGTIQPRSGILELARDRVLNTEPGRRLGRAMDFISERVDPLSDADIRLAKLVYHGSPHLFEKFDIAKVGTGEGAQAFGHGLYFAENPAVAKSYKEALTRNAAPNNRGALYEVDLSDADIPKMLDWDAPLERQPESVRAAITTFYKDHGLRLLPGSTGKTVYEDMVIAADIERLGGYGSRPSSLKSGALGDLANQVASAPKHASQMLYEMGVPGIAYMDRSSRRIGAGTRNYVVFNPEKSLSQFRRVTQ